MLLVFCSFSVIIGCCKLIYISLWQLNISTGFLAFHSKPQNFKMEERKKVSARFAVWQIRALLACLPKVFADLEWARCSSALFYCALLSKRRWWECDKIEWTLGGSKKRSGERTFWFLSRFFPLQKCFEKGLSKIIRGLSTDPILLNPLPHNQIRHSKSTSFLRAV